MKDRTLNNEELERAQRLLAVPYTDEELRRVRDVVADWVPFADEEFRRAHSVARALCVPGGSTAELIGEQA